MSDRESVTTVNRRGIIIVYGLIILAFAVLVVMIGRISIIKHKEYSGIASSQQLRDTIISANRGTIYDSNMNVIAESATCWTVVLSPLDISTNDYAKIASGLSEILGVDYDTILEKCSKKNYYEIIKRKVELPIVEEIRSFIKENEVNGIYFIEDSKRYYPYGNLASTVIGFVGTDNYGLAGVEAYYDDYLSGTAGRVLTAKNAVGTDMYYEYETVYEAEEGYSLVLTIDETIQRYLESALETAVKEHNVKNRATGIIMNVNNGEIYGMATKSDYDLNSPYEITDEDVLASLAEITDEEEYNTAYNAAMQKQWNNKAISEIYEPGSVFKAVTASIALETGSVSLDSTYDCYGFYQVTSSVKMNCAKTDGHGHETFSEAIINSCNPAFIQIGQSIGSENFYNYFKAFGLTEKTGIDLPGESGSDYYTADELGVVQLASCSYGQSNSVTPIQMITAFSAVVNGGYLVQPHVVSKIIDSDGNTVKTVGTEIKRQVISNETSETMALILERVVSEANGRNTYLAGYRIGGKSGTSQKLGQEKGKYVASFCAFAPADDPEIAVLILLDEAYSDISIYGSTLVGPVVQSVMSKVLPYLGIDPVYSEDEMENSNVSTPNVLGYSLTNAYSVLQRVGLIPNVVGEGTTVASQYPSAWQSVPIGSSVTLYTEEDITEKLVEMPNLVGRSFEFAKSALTALGLNIKYGGISDSNSTVTAQSIEAGTSVPLGTVIEISLFDTTLED